MAFFTSQSTTLHQPDSQSNLKTTRKISQPAMHIHASGNARVNDIPIRNPENVRTNITNNNKNPKRSSISDEILGDEDLRDVDVVFESLLTSTFSENESSSSMTGSKSASRVHKKDKQLKSGTRKIELGKSSNLGGERIGNIREEKEDVATGTANRNTASSSQTSISKHAMISNKKTSSVTRKPSKSKLVAGEVKLSAIPASVEEHMQSVTTRSEKQAVNHHQQQQHFRASGGCEEREKVPKDKNLKRDRKLSSENQEGSVVKDMYKKSSGNIPNDPLGSLPTSHTKKYLPRQQTWAGPQGSTPPPPISA